VNGSLDGGGDDSAAIAGDGNFSAISR